MKTLKLHFCKTTQSSRIIFSNSNNCFCVSTCNYLRVLLSPWLTVLLKWTISECEMSPSVCHRICSQMSKKQTWYSGLMRSPHSAQNLQKSFWVQASFSVFKQAESRLCWFSSWTSLRLLGSVTHLILKAAQVTTWSQPITTSEQKLRDAESTSQVAKSSSGLLCSRWGCGFESICAVDGSVSSEPLYPWQKPVSDNPVGFMWARLEGNHRRPAPCPSPEVPEPALTGALRAEVWLVDRVFS